MLLIMWFMVHWATLTDAPGCWVVPGTITLTENEAMTFADVALVTGELHCSSGNVVVVRDSSILKESNFGTQGA